MKKDCWVEKIDSSGKGICIHHSDYISEALKFVKNYDLNKGDKLIIWQNFVGKVFSRTSDGSGIIINKYYDYLLAGR